ncbi:MAG TPA: hypothetical protein VGQ76_12610 [Thermoanaerobaculia bacterium]|jgi:hypothetical protein|nr:hypothetical protein [Thermoanaerobaculia bacterium]
MMRKSDWDAASDDVIAEKRRALGPPPTADEVLAFFDGTLSGADAERVRELLAWYPDLARLASSPLPASEELVDKLSSDELESDWHAIRARLAPREPVPIRHVQVWRAFAIAASLATMVLGTLLILKTRNEHRLRNELRQPQFRFEPLVMYPEGATRGGATTLDLPSNTNQFLLVAAPLGETRYPDYRAEILNVESSPPRSIWSARGLREQSDGTFAILVSRHLLERGTYRLTIDGINDERLVPLASYRFRVPAR